MQPSPWEDTSPIFDHEAGVKPSRQLGVDERVLLGNTDLLLPSRFRSWVVKMREVSLAAVAAWFAAVVLARVFLFDATAGTLLPLGWLVVYVGGTMAAVLVAVLLLYRMRSR